jgi:hydroxymethylbilane synthase
LEGINQKEVMVCTQAERACLEGLGGGCHLPLGALAELSPNGKTILLKTALTLPDGSGRIRVSMMGDPEAPKTLGQEAARKILGKKNYQATRKVLVALGMLEK